MTRAWWSTSRSGLLLLLLLGLPGGRTTPAGRSPVGSRRGAIGGPTVLPAYRTPQGVEFSPPDSVPWDSLVPPRLRERTLASDAAARKALYDKRTDFGTEVQFTLRLTPALASRHYYLADSTGILAITPDSLVGSIAIAWVDSRAVIARYAVFGNLRARVASSRGGGFVFASETPITLTTRPASYRPDDLLLRSGQSYPHQGTPFWDIIRQYTIEQGGPAPARRWIWIEWRPDSEVVEGGCESRFSLFGAGPPPTVEASADSECDV